MPVRVTKEKNGYRMEISSTKDGSCKTYIFNKFKDMVDRMQEYFGHPEEPLYTLPTPPPPPPPPATPKPMDID